MLDPVIKQVYSEIEVGRVLLRFLSDEEGRMGFSMIPLSKRGLTVSDEMKRLDPMLQYKLAGDSYSTGHSNGRTMRNSESVRHRLKFKEQTVVRNGRFVNVTTRFEDSRGILATHVIEGNGLDAFTCSESVTNSSCEELTLEFMESFAISDLTPFAADPGNDRLLIYRMRGEWADEGNLEVLTPFDLKIEPRPKRFDAITAPISHLGTNASIEHAPFLALRDTKEDVIWGGLLTHASSWQMDLYRRDNGITLCGGIADADRGCWLKRLKPGETFEAPKALMAVTEGDVDDLCSCFTQYLSRTLESLPEVEDTLPIQYNEYRSTIGKPTEEKVLRQAEALQGRGITYFVTDAGWFNNDSGKWYEFTGDWIPDPSRYPHGLKYVNDRLKELGFLPGIWFEPETCGIRSRAWQTDKLLVKRYGKVLTSGWRRFIDLETEAGWNYLDQRIAALLKENGFAYVKLDSNETLGSGKDGYESLGEGCRRYSLRLRDFYLHLKETVPGLVIENCAAGSARAVESFTSITALTSFSDAFEHANNPIVAANLQRLIPARQILIWCVVDPAYDEQTLRYFLSSATLGRMCVSGDVAALAPWQNALLDESIAFYELCKPVIKYGTSRRYGPSVESTDIPKGYQAIVRKELPDQSENKTRAENQKRVRKSEQKQILRKHILVTVHCFHEAPSEIRVPLGKEKTQILSCFKSNQICVLVEGNELVLRNLRSMTGAAILLEG